MKFEKDKWRHLYVGIGLGFFLQMMAFAFLPLFWLWSALIVLFLVAAASYGFELISLITGRGHYDIIDAVAGVIGGVAGMLLAFAAHWLL